MYYYYYKNLWEEVKNENENRNIEFIYKKFIKKFIIWKIWEAYY